MIHGVASVAAVAASAVLVAVFPRSILAFLAFQASLLFVYTVLIIANVVLSWVQQFRPIPYNVPLRAVTGFIEESTNPYLNVFRSLSAIYAQVIDDQSGHTITSASSVDRDLREKMKGLKKSEQAKLVGQTVAERAKTKEIQTVVFDRGGYRYIGRIKALADGAREGGLQF